MRTKVILYFIIPNFIYYFFYFIKCLEIRIIVFRFAPMTSLQKYDFRHQEVKNKLLSVAKEKLDGEVMKASTVIAKTLEVSPQTVYNYLTGRIKDGYLAEAILREIRNYKS